MKQVLLRLSENFRANSSPNFSLFRLFLIKLNILLLFAFLSFSKVSRKRSLRGSRKFLLSQVPKRAIVLGNGPSLSNLNIQFAQQQQALGNLHIFAVNNYLTIKISESLVPDFLVLSDPEHRLSPHTKSTPDAWTQLFKAHQVTPITPSDWHPIATRSECLEEKCLHFDDRSLQGFSRNINPLKPRTYPSLTAFKALAFALSSRYEEVYMLGIDNTGLANVSLNPINQIILKSNHASSSYAGDLEMTEYYKHGIGDVYYDISETFLGMKRAFSNERIVNLDSTSLIDFIPKISRENWGSSLVQSPMNSNEV
jgi:hypothetical protein